MKALHKTVVLVPTYNEHENVEYIIEAISQNLPDASILIIDDNSPDGTGEKVQELQKQNKNVELLSRPGKEGLGRAYQDGFRAVLRDPGVEHVIMMDADGSHAAEYLPTLVKESERVNLVIGSRYVKGGGIEEWEPWRYALSKYGNIYARVLTGLPVQDLTAGFMCFRADLLRKIDLDKINASGYAFQIELKFYSIRHAGAAVCEVPIVFRSRRGGESKISRHIIREGLTTPWRILGKRVSGI